MSTENKTIQITSVCVSMELLAKIYDYLNFVNTPFTEKEPYIMGIREAINKTRLEKEAELANEKKEVVPEPPK